MSETSSIPTLAMFADLVGAAFTVRVAGDDQAAEITLTEATALPRPTSRDDVPLRSDPFTLIFKTDENVTMEQGTYVVEHESLESMDMFLVPVGFGEYQAIYT